MKPTLAFNVKDVAVTIIFVVWESRNILESFVRRLKQTPAHSVHLPSCDMIVESRAQHLYGVYPISIVFPFQYTYQLPSCHEVVWVP